MSRFSESRTTTVSIYKKFPVAGNRVKDILRNRTEMIYFKFVMEIEMNRIKFPHTVRQLLNVKMCVHISNIYQGNNYYGV